MPFSTTSCRSNPETALPLPLPESEGTGRGAILNDNNGEDGELYHIGKFQIRLYFFSTERRWTTMEKWVGRDSIKAARRVSLYDYLLARRPYSVILEGDSLRLCCNHKLVRYLPCKRISSVV